MKDSTKKWLAVGCGAAVCIALVVLIAGSFNKKPVLDEGTPSASPSPTASVTIQPPESVPPSASVTPTEQKKDEVVVQPVTPAAVQTPDPASGADSNGTEQTIQADPVKPSPPPEALKDPTKTPDGTPVESAPAPAEEKPAPVTEKPAPDLPSDGGSGGGGLPGFGELPYEGDTQIEHVDGSGDINKQVGSM